MSSNAPCFDSVIFPITALSDSPLSGFTEQRIKLPGRIDCSINPGTRKIFGSGCRAPRRWQRAVERHARAGGLKFADVSAVDADFFDEGVLGHAVGPAIISYIQTQFDIQVFVLKIHLITNKSITWIFQYCNRITFYKCALTSSFILNTAMIHYILVITMKLCTLLRHAFGEIKNYLSPEQT